MSGKDSWKNPADFSIDDILAEAREIKKKYTAQAEAYDMPEERKTLSQVDEILAGVWANEPKKSEPQEAQEKTREREIVSKETKEAAAFSSKPTDYCFGVPDHTEVLPNVADAKGEKPLFADGQNDVPQGDIPRFERKRQAYTGSRNIRKPQPEGDFSAPSSQTADSHTRLARTHFIKTAPGGEEFTPEPPEMIEKPAILRKESQFDKTADLQAVPTIVPVDDSMTRAVAGQREPVHAAEKEKNASEDVVEGQIRLSGFDEDESPVKKVDEYQVERELEKARQEKIKQFRLFSHDEPTNEEVGEEELDAPSFQEISDYTSPGDAPAVLLELKNTRRMLSLRTAAIGVIEAVMLAFSILSVAQPSVFDTIFGETVVYIGVTAALLVAALFAGLPAVLSGWKGIFTGRVNDDGALAFAGTVTFAHTVLMLWFPSRLSEGISLFPVMYLLCLFLNHCGKCVRAQRMIRSFGALTGAGGTHTVESITNEQDALEIGRSLVVGQPEIQYSQRSKFPSHFMEIANLEEPADTLAARVTYIAMGACVLLGAIVFAVKKDWLSAVTAFTAACCISIPAGNLLTSNLPLLRAADDLEGKGALLNGYAGVAHCSEAGAVVIEAAELFPQGSCCLHGIKTFGGMRVDEAILYTAAVVIGANEPLGDVFDKVIEQKREILPKAEDIVYEDRMGNSAWIYSRKVLVGNRELLVQHGVEVPEREFELKYRHDGRELLYLAIAGKVSAMFVVSYQIDEEVRERLCRLERTGITVLVRTSDPNIEEEMLTRCFDLPEGFLRVITSHAGRIFVAYTPETAKETDAYAVTNGKASALLEVMDAAFHLKNCRSTATVMQMVGIGLGFALTALLFLTGGAAYVKPLQLLLLQAVWAAVVMVTSRYRKLS